MANGSIATKTADYTLVSMAPDVCWTKVGKSWRPIPYNITHTMDNSENVSPNVFAGGKEAFMHGESFITGVTGDEPGRRGGIVTGTLTEISFGLEKSGSVYVNGKPSVRTGDQVWMNQTTPAAKQGKVGPDKPTSWVKVVATYDDPWKTPVPNAPIIVKIGGTPVAPLMTLSSGTGSNSTVSSESMAKQTADEPGTLVLTGIDPESVEVEGDRLKGIQEVIVSQRDGLEMLLDGAYRNTVHSMREFQQVWDAEGYGSFITSTWDGIAAGADAWYEDSKDLFTIETWQSLKGAISTAGGKMADAAYSNLESARENLDQLLEEGEENDWSWSWLGGKVEDKAKAIDAQITETVESAIDSGQELLDDAQKLVDISAKVFKHKDEILNLCTYLAEADLAKIENFIDTVVADIDPELAKELRTDTEGFSAAIEVLNDDSGRIFMAYLSLTIDAVPPNFYGYISGKAGVYIFIELILFLVLAIFTAGTGVAVRIGTIAARIATSGTKAVALNKKIQTGRKAVSAFTNNIDDFLEGSKLIKGIGSNLRRTRTQGIKASGNHGQTLAVTKETKRQEAKCRICGSTDHTTPRTMKGSVEYK